MNDYAESMRSEGMKDILESTRVSVEKEYPAKNGGKNMWIVVDTGGNNGLLRLFIFVGTTGFPRLFSIEDTRGHLLWSYNEFSADVGFIGHVHIIEFDGDIVLMCIPKNKKEIVLTLLLKEFQFMSNLWSEGTDASVDRKVAVTRALNSDGHNLTYRFNNAEQKIVCARFAEEDKIPATRDWHITLSDILEKERNWRRYEEGEGECP